MSEGGGIRDLELWCKKITESYPGVKIENMITSWRDGLAFCAIIHHFRPDLIDFSKLNKEDIYRNNELAFKVAEVYLDIPAFLGSDEMADYQIPDYLSILAYLSQFYEVFAISHGSSPLNVVSDTRTTSSRRGIITSASTQMAVESNGHNIEILNKRICAQCGLYVFIAQCLYVRKMIYHRTCFRCSYCNNQLFYPKYKITETENQYICKICYDDRNYPLGNSDQNESNCMFKTALDSTNFKSSDDTIEFLQIRSKFIEDLLESKEVEYPATNPQKSKPPLQLYNNPINNKSSVNGKSFKTLLEINNNHSSSNNNQQKPTSPEIKNDTNIVNIHNASLPSSVLSKHSTSKYSDITVKNGLPNKNNSMEVIVLDSFDSVIVISDDSIVDDNTQYQTQHDNMIENNEIINISDGSILTKNSMEDQSVELIIPQNSIGFEDSPQDFKMNHIITNPIILKNGDEVEKESSKNYVIESSISEGVIESSIKERNKFSHKNKVKCKSRTKTENEINSNAENIETNNTKKFIKEQFKTGWKVNGVQNEPSNIRPDETSPKDLSPFEEPTSNYKENLHPLSDEEQEEEHGPLKKIIPNPNDYVLKGNTGDTPEFLKKIVIKRISINEPLLRKIQAPKISLSPFWDHLNRDESSLESSGPNTPDTQPGTPEVSIGPFESPTSISSGTSNVTSSKWKTEHNSSLMYENKRRSLPLASTPFITRYAPSISNCSPIYKSLEHLNVIQTNENKTETLYLSVISQTNSLESEEQESESLVEDEANRDRQGQSRYIQNKSRQSSEDKFTCGKSKSRKGQAPSMQISQKSTVETLLMEVQKELNLIEGQHEDLEKQGVRLEKIIRERCGSPNLDSFEIISIEVECLILQLFEVIRKKNELRRRQTGLLYL